MVIKYFGICILLIGLTGCSDYVLQELEIDFGKSQIKLLDDSYLIDSIRMVNLEGELVFSQSLIDKTQGRYSLNLFSLMKEYETINQLKAAKDSCNSYLDLEVFIRKQGFVNPINNNPDAITYKPKSVQKFSGIPWRFCSNEIITVKAESRYR